MRTCTKMSSRPGVMTAGSVAVALLLAVCLQVVASDRAGDDGPRPAIWRVEDADSELWIFGSFHALTPGAEWRSAGLEEALQSVERVWFETNLDPEVMQGFASKLAAAGMSGEGDLTDRLSPREAEALAEAAERLGLPVSSLDAMQPWYAALSLIQAGASAAGFEISAGVELTLQQEAVRAGLQIRGLESCEEHLSLFTGLSDEAQWAFLRSAIIELESTGELLAATQSAWLAQDLSKLEQLGRRSFGDVHPQLQSRLVTDRNRAWVSRISGILEGSGHDLVVVGAVHTVGPQGVVELLRQAGHHVNGPATVSAGHDEHQ